ncbi:hypothetical protein DMB92_03825 [Campylobacter sp. MIT 99-7217]|uniref:hypothetical protein n=1 Tax=Campylobacter sp. MIT 99-7217 TaxID=535091 RepID=UPI00115A8442|nr:hypothetical protein [Campylobacter sp. MIT 99-7217]TQR33096.1 hypothetical protein DMB92_03825 [Campylobacter sp. MIT 99-7217]
MALKEDLNAIKKELNTEEQLIENFIKGERFFKKYKYIFFVLIVALICYGIFSYVSNLMHEQNIQKSNQIYSELIKDPNNEGNLQELKKVNPNLYAIFILSHSQFFNDTEDKIKEAVQLKINPLLKDILALSLNENSQFLVSYNKLLQAFELLKEDKVQEANIILSKIPLDSRLNEIANNLRHYKGNENK